jgi:hypothetical protein
MSLAALHCFAYCVVVLPKISTSFSTPLWRWRRSGTFRQSARTLQCSGGSGIRFRRAASMSRTYGRQTGLESSFQLRSLRLSVLSVSSTREWRTLSRSAAMPGDLFYFVRTDAMHRRAQAKIQNSGYAITAATIRNT